MSSPHSVPPDLRRRIEAVLGQRSHGAAEVWGEVRDWLETHQVEVPEGLSCRRFCDNELQLHARAYNLATSLRSIDLPKAMAD